MELGVYRVEVRGLGFEGFSGSGLNPVSPKP